MNPPLSFVFLLRITPSLPTFKRYRANLYGSLAPALSKHGLAQSMSVSAPREQHHNLLHDDLYCLQKAPNVSRMFFCVCGRNTATHSLRRPPYQHPFQNSERDVAAESSRYLNPYLQIKSTGSKGHVCFRNPQSAHLCVSASPRINYKKMDGVTAWIPHM